MISIRCHTKHQQRIYCRGEEDGKKIKAISGELSAASYLFFYDLNHYDKRVSSIVLRVPADPSDGRFHDPCIRR